MLAVDELTVHQYPEYHTPYTRVPPYPYPSKLSCRGPRPIYVPRINTLYVCGLLQRQDLILTRSVASERTPTQHDSTDEDDGDADEVEFVLEVTPIQSEIDSESVAGVSTMSDIFSVSSQNHRGSGVACRYYNRGRCFKGTSCPYSHAPDQYSLRSHPEYVLGLPIPSLPDLLDSRGTNVCLYFIHNDKCRYTEQQCNYSHRRSDLHWNDEELKVHLVDAIANRRKENAKIGKGRAPLNRNRDGDKLTRPATISAQSSHKIRAAPRQANRCPVAVKQLQLPLQSLPPFPRLPLRISEVQKRWEHEMALRLASASLVNEEISTLLSYGTPKPWVGFKERP